VRFWKKCSVDQHQGVRLVPAGFAGPVVDPETALAEHCDLVLQWSRSDEVEDRQGEHTQSSQGKNGRSHYEEKLGVTGWFRKLEAVC